LSSGKTITLDTDLEPQYQVLPGIFFGKRNAPAGSQVYFDNPCENMKALQHRRKQVIKDWRYSKAEVSDASHAIR